MLGSTFILLYVFVSQTDSPKGLASVVIDDLVELTIHFIFDFFNLSVFVKIVRAAIFNDFRSSFNMQSFTVRVACLNVLNNSRHTLTL